MSVRRSCTASVAAVNRIRGGLTLTGGLTTNESTEPSRPRSPPNAMTNDYVVLVANEGSQLVPVIESKFRSSES
jgi:hypothetical protein